MAHELDRTTGAYAVMAVGKTPWHREGIVLLEPPPNVEVAMEVSHTNYDLELRPVQAVLGDGRVVSMNDHRAVVRTDTHTVLSLVSADYEAIPNRQGFKLLDPLIAEGLATIETMGALRGGRDAWAQVLFNIKDAEINDLLLQDGKALPYGLVHLNHAGLAARCLDTTTLVVCANTLAQTDGQGVRIIHTQGAGERLAAEAAKLWGSLIDRYRQAAREAALFRAFRPMTQDQFVHCVLDAAAPIPTPTEEQAAAAHRALEVRGGEFEDHLVVGTTARKQRELITELWDGQGLGITGDRSAWEAYNAAVEALDHHSGVYRTRGSRVESLMAGRLGQAKTRVLGRLRELVTA